MQRMWINQPSIYQQHHRLHGTPVLAVHDYDNCWRVYFLSGDVISMQMDKSALSNGWPNESTKVKHIRLDEHSVMRAQPGHKYCIKNLQTGVDEVVKCEQLHISGAIYFTRDSCPDGFVLNDKPYEDIFQHIRPLDREGGLVAAMTREKFADLFRRGAYRIA